MKRKIPILLLTKDRPSLLEKVLMRIIKHTDWTQFDLWILDNFSTPSNKKIIEVFKYNFPSINVFSTSYNQIGRIQNEIIGKLKADFYIKIDDDILVSENWTKGFVNVFERNHFTMSFGSVVIPINGFGWIPFLEIMGLRETFRQEFPDVEFKQDCFDVPVIKDARACEFIWNACIDIDQASKTFVANQAGNYQDLYCPHRYSIGAIVFSHKSWEKMGGWKVQEGYDKLLRRQKAFQGVANSWKKITKNPRTYTKANQLADIIAKTDQGHMGEEEKAVFEYSVTNNLTIPVTTESIVFHFSFGTHDQYMMNKFYLKLK